MTQTPGSILDVILKGVIDLDPDDDVGESPSPPKKWRNKYRWRHPELGLPRPDGVVPPGGEFATRGVYPTKEIAEQKADEQLYGFSGKCWPPQMRMFLQYLGPFKVDE